MKDIPVTLNVFERTDFHPDRHGKGPRDIGEMDPDRRRFVNLVQRVLKQHHLTAKFNGHKWPKAEDEGGRGGGFNYLQESPYGDAEYSIVFVDGLAHVGPEVGSLILFAARKLRHCMIVSTHKCDTEYALGIRKGLNRIAPLRLLHEDQDQNSNVLTARTNSEVMTTLDAEVSGFISYYDIKSMQHDNSLSRLHSVVESA
ncbi:MAG: hypothetical protein O2904_00570 [bacterium]|nr:hypothetical protein [bacterium]